MRKVITDLPIEAGLFTEQSARGAKGRWKDADKVRFRYGLPEKIGGWEQLQPQFLGLARRIHDWTSLDDRQWTAIGTDKKLYLWQNQTLYDITPLRLETTLTNPFSTTAGSSTVVVAHTGGHGAQVGDFVTFDGAGTVDGVNLDGEFEITAIVSFEEYEIEAVETAIAGAIGVGGTVTAQYDISVGGANTDVGFGWGVGGWSEPGIGGGWGTPRQRPSQLIPARTWSLDNWGEDLIATPNGKSIYWWDRTTGPTSRAVVLPNAPDRCNLSIISQRDRQLFALGCTDYVTGQFDPLLIRYCSREDFNDWIPSDTNTAGDLRLYRGSKIVTGIRTRAELLVFTDVSVHSVNYLGEGLLYGINVVGENVAIMSQNAAVAMDHRVLFMGESDFYLYDGVLRVLPCPVRNRVFESIDRTQRVKVHAGLNREFNEVWWFYPKAAEELALVDVDYAAVNWGGLSPPGVPQPELTRPLRDDVAADISNRDDVTITDGGWVTNDYDLGVNDFDIRYTVSFDGWTADIENRTGLAAVGFEAGNSWDLEAQPDGQRVYFFWGGVAVAIGRHYNSITMNAGTQVVISSSSNDAVVNYEVADLPFLVGEGEAQEVEVIVRRVNNRYSVWVNEVQYIDSFDPGNYQSGSTGPIGPGPGADAANRQLGVAMSVNDGSTLPADRIRLWGLEALFAGAGESLPQLVVGPSEITNYVCFNFEEGTWTLGTMERTAWADASEVLQKPYAAGVDGYLYQHETGVDADGAALPSFIESFDMEIPEAGEMFTHIDQLIPDFLTLEGSVDLTLKGKKYPHQPSYQVKGPYTVDPTIQKVSTRIRGRQVALRMESSDVGDKWRLATIRGRLRAHGKRA